MNPHRLIDRPKTLIKLKNQIDLFLHYLDHENAQEATDRAEEVKKLIKELAIELDLHRDFCCEFEGIDAGLLTKTFAIRVKATDMLDRALTIKPSCSKSASDVTKFKQRIEQVIDVLDIKPKQLKLL